ncbi:MAG: hypothetical protein Ct9H300mP8_09050 [Gammaproteobacteria bacterium]|nr:MAG: hypothetical protein Ct9H300mP8_09050 [Gammaproteobacteria bacterium]
MSGPRKTHVLHCLMRCRAGKRSQPLDHEYRFGYSVVLVTPGDLLERAGAVDMAYANGVPMGARWTATVARCRALWFGR